MSDERVSVVIPSYNYAHFLPSAINSALAQTHRNIEVIVVDDGSVDHTASVATSYGDRIRYIRQENQGLSAARNRGLLAAEGTLIQFLDADDVLGRTSVQKRVAYLERYPDISAVICRTCYFSKSPPLSLLAPLLRGWRQPLPSVVDLALHFRNIAPPHAFLVRKSAIDQHGLKFDTQLRACEDYDFWFRLALYSGPPGVLRSGWVYYRQHPGSMSRQLANQYRHDAELCRRVFRWVHSEHQRMGERSITDFYAAMLAASLATAGRLADQDRTFCRDFISSHARDVAESLVTVGARRPASTAAEIYIALARIALHKLEREHQIIDPNAARTFRTALSHPGGGFRKLIMDGTSPPLIRLRLMKLGAQYLLMRATQRIGSTKTMDEGT